MIPPVRLILGVVVAATVVASAPAQVTRNTAPATAPNPATSVDQGNIDLAYGAFQRGHYLTAFNEASKRAQQNDPAAMTLLGEIYAQGLGVGRDDSKAAQWYKMAAAKGDRDALFALAMFNFQGRAVTRNLEEAARLLEAGPSSVTPVPPTTSASFICKASNSRRTSSAPVIFSRWPLKAEIRKRNTRSLPCTRKAAACRRT